MARNLVTGEHVGRDGFIHSQGEVVAMRQQIEHLAYNPNRWIVSDDTGKTVARVLVDDDGHVSVTCHCPRCEAGRHKQGEDVRALKALDAQSFAEEQRKAGREGMTQFLRQDWSGVERVPQGKRVWAWKAGDPGPFWRGERIALGRLNADRAREAADARNAG